MKYSIPSASERTQSFKQLESAREQQPAETSDNNSLTDSTHTQNQASQEDGKEAGRQKAPKINKKLKRDLEKKIKEQQEAEERFRLQQIERQKREQ